MSAHDVNRNKIDAQKEVRLTSCIFCGVSSPGPERRRRARSFTDAVNGMRIILVFGKFELVEHWM